MSGGDFNDFIENYGTNDLKRVIEITAPPSEEIFINRLYEEIEAIVRLVEGGPKERANDSEDRLSVEIVSNLKSAGYNSIKDPTQRGHVDILVETKNSRKYKWYGEAKIWNGVEYLDGGMNQLLTRYASGRESNLGFLVYFRCDNLIQKMDDWKNFLNNKSDVDESLTEIVDQFSFYTTHVHSAGSQIKVRHFSFNIHWGPK